MRCGVLLAVLATSITMATAAAAQDLPPPPPPPHWEPDPSSPPMHLMMPGMPGMMPGMPGMMPGMREHMQVTVESTGKPVVLERRVRRDEMDGRTLFVIPRSETTETWEQVCVSPCTLLVDRASTYRIARENFVTQSGTFLLPATADQVKLDVKPGNWWWHNVGTKAIAVGIAAGATGASLISLAHTWDKHKSEVHVRTVGIISASVGALALAIGIPLAIATRTRVTENGIKLGKLDPNKPHDDRPKLTLDGLVF